ncbi:MAG: hypothetical protein GY700_06430 [Propionibacteriaceae bacterium]|nr:hypothetical protein [Propionibacteriaceae bacterium]
MTHWILPVWLTAVTAFIWVLAIKTEVRKAKKPILYKIHYSCSDDPTIPSVFVSTDTNPEDDPNTFEFERRE